MPTPRFFNTAGPCNPQDHYMLPSSFRLPPLLQLIERKNYFVIHAPRQSGKTTCLKDFAAQLNQEGRHAALLTSCETAQAAEGNVERGINAVLDALLLNARRQLPPELRPGKPDPEVHAENRLGELLFRWAESCPKPVVLFFDEIDALRDMVLISVLRQLRDGYQDRPIHFPQSVGLIGLRDVRDYKLRLRPDSSSLGTSSPFNIKVESLTLKNFTAAEVASLYSQHTEATGQRFTPEALALAWELTRGQPWLVNALAAQLTDKDVSDRSIPITAEQVEAAKETLIQRRDTHLDSLIERLREDRVRRVIEPILAGGMLLDEALSDDIAFVKDLGLVESSRGEPLRIANPIYKEVIPRALVHILQENIPQKTIWYVRADGTLDVGKLLDEFQKFWLQHSPPLLQTQAYPEAAPHLVFLAFLQRIVNGGGTIDREYAVGSERMDVCIRWRLPAGLQREAFELKVWRDKRPDPLAEGLEQLGSYLDGLKLEHGALLLFDRRSGAPPLEERCSSHALEHLGRSIRVLRL